LKAGSKEQAVLKKKGDDLRIDWGNLYIYCPDTSLFPYHQICTPNDPDELKTIFKKGWVYMKAFVAGEKDQLLNTQLSFQVDHQPQQQQLILGYDDLYSIQYFGQNLQAWWKKNFSSMEELLKRSAAEYSSIKNKCDAFDKQLYSDAVKAGGEKYAKLCV